MPAALTIVRTEHLPEETTLLIHYSIGQAGTWSLAQLLSAYRSVLDNGWTVMYPNTQHPRHTDFPITVAENGNVAGTFAWNYGGIRGVDPENFNSERSYLIQLTVYNPDEGTVTNQTQTATAGGETNSSTGGQVTPASVPTKATPPRRVPPRIKTPPVRPGPLPPTPGPVVKDAYAHIPPRRNPLPAEPSGDPGEGSPSGPVLSAPAPIYPGVFLPPPFEPDYVAVLDPRRTDNPSTFQEPIWIINPSYAGPGGGGGGGVFIPGGGGGGGGGSDPGYSEPNGSEPSDPRMSEGPGTYEVPLVLINDNYTPIIRPPNVDPRSLEGELPYDNPLWLISDVRTSPPIITVPPRSLNPKIPVTDGSPVISINSTPIIVNRPNEDPPGGSIGTSNPYQSRTVRSNATASDVSTVKGRPSRTYQVDLAEVTTSVGLPGYLNKYNYAEKIQAGVTQDNYITHVETSSVIPGASLIIETPIDDVSKGNSIFVSCAYSTPPGVEVDCALELWAKDSQGRTILIYSKEHKLVKLNSPATLVHTIESYNFTPGPIIFIVFAKDIQNKVIGVASKKIVIRPALTRYGTDSDNRIRENSNLTSSNGLPANIVDLLNIDKPPVSCYIKDSKPVRLLFSKLYRSEDKFGIIAVTSSKNLLEKYKIDVYTAPVEGEFIPVPNIKGQYDNIIFSETRSFLASSTERIILDKNELNPQSHTVGLSPFSTTESTLLVCLSPDVKSRTTDNRQIDIYVNSSYVLKPITVTISKQSPTVYTISGYGPYVIETLGLIVHGKNPDNISENYVIMYANTGVDGYFVWPNVSIQAGEYYSIIVPKYGKYNPLTGKVYTAKL